MPRPPNPHPYRVKIVRYEMAGGKRCKASDPGAVKRVEESLTYYADLPGKPRVPLKTSKESVAWKRLNELLKEHADGELGIRDEYSRHARRPIAEHLDDWTAMLTAKGTTAQQIELAKGRLLRLAELAGWERLPQIDADSAFLALAKIQEPPQEDGSGGLGKSAATRNHYLGHLKAFVSWCHDGGRTKKNPVRRIAPVKTESDRRHARRCPAAEEVAELCRWLGTEAAPVRRGLSPLERRLGYQVSMATGFRAGELRALSPASFRLKESSVTVPAGYSKRRRQDTQQLPAWLVAELQAWFDAGGGWTWPRLDKAGPGKLLYADLADCRAAWIAAAKTDAEQERRAASDFLRYRVETPEGPRFWDYHSFRHAYNSYMANLPGMDLKTLLSLTRLSSAELALKTYAHSDQQRIRAAVDQLPAPETLKPQRKK